jgi:V/A-type H+-transporting ATPase subunit A
MALLQKESELQEIVKLVGPDALPPRERALLESARMIREDFLQQSAFHEVDTYCSSKKQYDILRIILKVSNEFQKAIEKNVLIDDIIKMKSLEYVARLKNVPIKEIEKKFTEAEKEIDKEFSNLTSEGD